MKKRLFGYDIAETDVLLNTLREENASLSTTVAALQKQLSDDENGDADHLSSLQTQNSQLNDKVSELAHALSKKDGENARLIQENTRQTEENSTLKKALEEQTAKAENFEKCIAEKDSTIEALRKALDEKNAALTHAPVYLPHESEAHEPPVLEPVISHEDAPVVQSVSRESYADMERKLAYQTEAINALSARLQDNDRELSLLTEQAKRLAAHTRASRFSGYVATPAPVATHTRVRVVDEKTTELKQLLGQLLDENGDNGALNEWMRDRFESGKDEKKKKKKKKD